MLFSRWKWISLDLLPNPSSWIWKLVHSTKKVGPFFWRTTPKWLKFQMVSSELIFSLPLSYEEKHPHIIAQPRTTFGLDPRWNVWTRLLSFAVTSRNEARNGRVSWGSYEVELTCTLQSLGEETSTLHSKTISLHPSGTRASLQEWRTLKILDTTLHISPFLFSSKAQHDTADYTLKRLMKMFQTLKNEPVKNPTNQPP